MRVFGVAAMAALLIGTAGLATPACAQEEVPHLNLIADAPSKTPDQVEAEQAKEKAYRESLRKIPNQKASNDPWGGVRSDPPKAAAPAAKTSAKNKAKAETRTGSN
jgi:hypothetical protein